MPPRREREKPLEDRCVAKVEASGGQALKLVLLGLMGWPDRTVLLPGGRVFFIETKRAVVGRVSRQQSFWAMTLTGLGFRVYTIDDDAQFDAALKEWL